MHEHSRKPLVITEHGSERLREYGFSAQFVRDSIVRAEHIRPSSENTWVMEAEIPGDERHLIRIIVADNRDHIRLVTAYPVSTIRARKGRKP